MPTHRLTHRAACLLISCLAALQQAAGQSPAASSVATTDQGTLQGVISGLMIFRNPAIAPGRTPSPEPHLAEYIIANGSDVVSLGAEGVRFAEGRLLLTATRGGADFRLEDPAKFQRFINRQTVVWLQFGRKDANGVYALPLEKSRMVTPIYDQLVSMGGGGQLYTFAVKAPATPVATALLGEMRKDKAGLRLVPAIELKTADGVKSVAVTGLVAASDSLAAAAAPVAAAPAAPADPPPSAAARAEVTRALAEIAGLKQGLFIARIGPATYIGFEADQVAGVAGTRITWKRERMMAAIGTRTGTVVPDELFDLVYLIIARQTGHGDMNLSGSVWRPDKGEESTEVLEILRDPAPFAGPEPAWKNLATTRPGGLRHARWSLMTQTVAQTQQRIIQRSPAVTYPAVRLEPPDLAGPVPAGLADRLAAVLRARGASVNTGPAAGPELHVKVRFNFRYLPWATFSFSAGDAATGTLLTGGRGFCFVMNNDERDLKDLTEDCAPALKF